MMQTFNATTRLPFPADDVFDWHASPGAFERLSPPWDPLRLVSRSGIRDGDRLEMRVRVGPFLRRWVAEHRNYVEGRQFQDVQLQGPFAVWEHTHTISPVDDVSCELKEAIAYRLPGGFLGRVIAGRSVRTTLDRLFAYRHRVIRDDLRAHAAYSKGRTMKILVTGAGGLLGSRLVPFLTAGGHEVVPLKRSKAGAEDAGLFWDPARGTIDREKLEGFDAVVHLAGENIGGRRWSAAQKAKIRDSRVAGTRLLSETLAGLNAPPRVLVCASAIGLYGDRGDELLDETSAAGEGFLPDVCNDWEAAADPAREKGVRVVHARFGVILSPEGGALQKMLFPFKMCAGGVAGNGRQYWSWVSIDDVVTAILHALSVDSVTGPINVVSPNPVTNREFTRTLGRVLRRPALFPLPGFAARLMLGEMADDLLLGSARVSPKRLQETGYEFRFPELEGALRYVLGRVEG
ncbi:MAG: TIGR01777 family oxidoreductase [Planctomycetaceae bacterium]